MREEIIKRVQEFVRAELIKSSAFEDVTEREAQYRIEHSFRVANIALEIAKAEGLDCERMYVTALLHDIGYATEMKSREDYRNHGRIGAGIARPFLKELGYSAEEIGEMCYSIAMHVDDQADCEGERTPFTLTTQDADNIDRFDAFRLYEGLAGDDYHNIPIADQKVYVEKHLEGLKRLREEPFGTATATKMWQDKVDFQLEFYKRLQHQIEISE